MTTPAAPPAPRASWPALLGIAAVIALSWSMVAVMRHATAGAFYFPIDDAYTQMAMGRTLAASGTYGFTAGHPATSSSSPLWVLALAAGFRVFGVRSAVPFGLNLLSALLAVRSLHRWLADCRIASPVRAVAIIVAVFVVPIAALVPVGLEHSTQVWLSLAFATAAARDATGATTGRTAAARLGVLAALLCATRFEGAFIVTGAAVLLAWRRRWSGAWMVAACGALPIVVHGIASRAIGWSFLPTSLLLDGRFPDFTTWNGRMLAAGGTALWALAHSRDVLLLVMVVGATIVVNWAFQRRPIGGGPESRGGPAAGGQPAHGAEAHGATMEAVLGGIFLIATLLQGQFAELGGSFHRYGAALVMIGIAAAVPLVVRTTALLFDRRRSPASAAIALRVAAAAVFLAAGCWQFGSRAAGTLRLVPRASSETWRQQAQLARFCRDDLAGRVVGVNDIGLVSYAGAVQMVDYIGLADVRIARLPMDPALSGVDALRLIDREYHVDVAIVYDTWFTPTPAWWTRVGQWTLDTQDYESDPTVSVYAVHPGDAPALAAAFRRFAAGLPAGVTATTFAP